MPGNRSLLTAFFVATCLALLAAPASSQTPHTHRHDFSGADRWAHVFDDPARDAWQKPHEVIQALALAPDATVADIGAGTGYFAIRLANMLPAGKVYAVDVEPDMVRHLAERAKREGRDNMIAIAGATNDPKLPEKVDLVLMVDVHHHIDERVRYFRDLRGWLKPGARIAIIDWRPDAPMGPPRSARLAADQIVDELSRAGYRLTQEHRFLPNQHFLVFSPGQ